MKSFLIDQKNQAITLYSFLAQNVPSLNQRNILRCIKFKKILINNNEAKAEYILKINDVITIDLEDKYFEFNHNLDFLNTNIKIDTIYEDDNICLIYKPKGLIIQSDAKEKINTLDNAFKKYLYDKNQYLPIKNNYYVPSLCNRLDFNTSGIVIGAKNIYALRIMNAKIANFEVRRFYLAWVNNKPPKIQDTLIGYLNKDFRTNKVQIFDHPQAFAIKVITKYKVIKTLNNKSLLELELVTGKSHQLRAHMKKIGCSIVNDPKYSDDKKNNFNLSQELVAYKIIFDFKTDAGILNYLNHKSFVLDIKF